MGVSLTYHDPFQTPLGALLSVVKIDLHDDTVKHGPTARKP